MRRPYLISLALSCFMALFFIGVAPANAEPSLDLILVEELNFPKTEEFNAVIEAVHGSTVSSRIAAEVVTVNYDVNDRVTQGSVLIRFRDEEFLARVAEIEANLMADKAQYQQAIARQKEASSETKRVNNLFKRQLLAQADLDTVTADLSVANAQVQAFLAQINSRQAQLQEANVQLSYTQIIAPYSGIVTERLIELGEMASPGQHLMTGVSLQQLRAVVNVPQYLLPAIISAPLPTLTLTDGRHIVGSKTTIVPSADVASHSIKVRVDLPSDIQSLYPGMYSKLKFVTGEENIIAISQSSVVERSEVTGVYVQDDENKVLLRQIRLGRMLENKQREVLAGLSVGESIAIVPHQAVQVIKEQQRVRLPQ